MLRRILIPQVLRLTFTKFPVYRVVTYSQRLAFHTSRNLYNGKSQSDDKQNKNPLQAETQKETKEEKPTQQEKEITEEISAQQETKEEEKITQQQFTSQNSEQETKHKRNETQSKHSSKHRSYQRVSRGLDYFYLTCDKIFTPYTITVSLLLIGLSAWYYFSDWEQKFRQAEFAKRQKKGGTTKFIGNAQIGGRFTLVDTEGRPITDSEFRGKWMLVYFGFTHCPDICPLELKKMTSALKRLPEHIIDEVVPIFIAVDSRRDSCQAVKQFLKDYHPKFVGLTGTEEQIEQACKKYRVYHTKPPADESEDYNLDHSIFVYLMNPKGQLKELFNAETTVQEMAQAIKQAVEKNKSKN